MSLLLASLKSKEGSVAKSGVSSRLEESGSNSRGAAVTGTLAEFLWVAAPKIAAGGAQLLANLFLVRRLGPENAGVLFVCITAIMLSDAVLGSSLDIAVLKLATSGAGRVEAASLRIQKAALSGKVFGCVILATILLPFSAGHQHSLVPPVQRRTPVDPVAGGAVRAINSSIGSDLLSGVASI
jgi:hypothetical protein